MITKDKSEDEYLNFVFLLLKCKQGQERKTLESNPGLVNIKLAEVMWQTATTFYSDPSKSTYVTSILRLRDQIMAELENDSIHLKFIHDLVNSDKDQEGQLIDSNRNLINRTFFDLAQKVAGKMLERNDSSGKWLLHRSKDLIHRHIVNVAFNEYIRNSKSNTLSIVSDHADILRFEYLEKWTEHLKVNLQSQRNTSLVEVLPTVKESIHIKLFSLEVELASQSMSVYRPNQPFNKI